MKDTEPSKSASDTPETDAMLDNQSHDDVKWDDACDQLAELCRSLERERNEAREAAQQDAQQDAQQELRTARNLADSAMWEADRLRCALNKVERVVAA